MSLIKHIRPFLILLFLLLFSGPVLAQDIKVSGNFTKAGLPQILSDIEQNYPVRFFYQEEWSQTNEISVQIDQQPLAQALEMLLQGSDLTFLLYSADKVIIAPKDRLGSLSLTGYSQVSPPSETTFLDSRFPLIVVGDSAGSQNTITNQVRITLTDKHEGQRLDGVDIYFEKLELTYNSNTKGQITMVLPAGVYQMEARRIGYEPFICHLNVLSSGAIDIAMDLEVVELQEVIVSGENPDQRLMNPQAGIVSITPKQMKEMPVFLGEADVIKTVLTIPGVTTIGEGAPGFFVRGGNIDQNLVMQDGAVFLNSSHALGFFSLFNPDLISNVQLYKGNIPAQFGGRLSSVLDVKLKVGDYSTTGISGGVGTVLSKLAVESPIVKDKISVLAGGRISYADWLLPIIKVPEIQESEAFFYDFNIKLSAKISEKGSLHAGYFQSFDRVNFEGEAGFEWFNKTWSLGWDQGFGQTLRSEFIASSGQTDNLTFDPSGLSVAELNNGLQFYKLKENLVMPWSGHLINAGAEWIYYQPQDEVLQTSGTSGEDNRITKDFGQEWAFYLNDEWEVSDKFALSAGLRASIFLSEERSNDLNQDQQYSTLEPRISLRYSFDPSTSFKASYNRTSQFIHLLSNTTGVLPNDQWILSNSIIKPSTSNNFSLGFFKNFNSNNWESSAELFYRRLSDIIEFQDFADLILNPDIEEEIIQSEGEAYGLELYLKKHFGEVTGNLSYTFSRTFFNLPEGVEGVNQDRFPAKFDRPHAVNLAMNWAASKKSRFGLVFNFTSGRPITAPVSTYNLGNVVVSQYSSRNEFRVPSYHRLDLSYTYKRNAVKRKKYQDSITFSIYNIYGRRNAFSVFFRKENNRPVQAFKLSVLGSAFPSITYTFEFK